MSKIVLSLLFFCVSVIGFSQASTFSGSVIEEESNTKMANAIITIEGTALASTTDENGQFSFNEKIPSGEHVVTVSKDGYELKLFMISVNEQKTLTTDRIELALTKKEKKRRKKLNKSSDKELKKIAKEKEKKLKKARKELEKREKKLAKQKKKLKKKNKDVIVNYDAVDPEIPVKETTDIPAVTPNSDSYTGLQVKYANILGITPQEISNIPLYEFIDGWMGTPYLWGGTNKDGIDCSSFTQRLFQSVYDLYIERTADAQQASKYTDNFEDTSFLREGDLLFFGEMDRRLITHVGVYLGNNKFVNATTRKTNGVSGVKIDDITDPFWRGIFCCAGRRINNN